MHVQYPDEYIFADVTQLDTGLRPDNSRYSFSLMIRYKKCPLGITSKLSIDRQLNS